MRPAGSFLEEGSSVATLRPERRTPVRAPGAQGCTTCPCWAGDLGCRSVLRLSCQMLTPQLRAPRGMRAPGAAVHTVIAGHSPSEQPRRRPVQGSGLPGRRISAWSPRQWGRRGGGGCPRGRRELVAPVAQRRGVVEVAQVALPSVASHCGRCLRVAGGRANGGPRPCPGAGAPSLGSAWAAGAGARSDHAVLAARSDSAGLQP